jgi:hypothetical protein
MWVRVPALCPLVDYGFTASVENDLDEIAAGERSRVEWLRRFYFGAEDGQTRPAVDSQRISAQGGLKRLIADRLEHIDARGVNSIPLDGTGAPHWPVYLNTGAEQRELVGAGTTKDDRGQTGVADGARAGLAFDRHLLSHRESAHRLKSHRFVGADGQ